ncbi:hypothetical protein SCLCIDRAFT_874918 [Scleroderma citrinum Foug A]|uniref:Uncharacterized protein n=1 Tax=Scleroderma citrinum Foug A TaxID=1036808 RepID=A0A0C3A9G0_9AGAM|nr:hypothetical protein SCLCIDRAFT_874918 [Scleroderma citrinum Foug A]
MVSNRGLPRLHRHTSALQIVKSVLTFPNTVRAGASFASTSSPFGVSIFSVASFTDYVELSRSARKTDSIGTHLGHLLLGLSDMLLLELTLDIPFRVHLQLLFFLGDLEQ